MYERWTNFRLSHHIVKKNPKLIPEINRKGLSEKAIHPAIPKRYSEIEESTKKIAASDHCSIAVKFEL